MWIAIVVGNLLIIGLGYFAYKMVMGDKNSDILEEEDFAEPQGGGSEDATAEGEAKSAPTAAASVAGLEDIDAELAEDLKDLTGSTELEEIVSEDDVTDLVDEVLGDDLDLPDDAIDIDPSSDK